MSGVFVCAGLNEESRVRAIRDSLNPSVFPDVANLTDNANLGRLIVLSGVWRKLKLNQTLPHCDPSPLLVLHQVSCKLPTWRPQGKRMQSLP